MSYYDYKGDEPDEPDCCECFYCGDRDAPESENYIEYKGKEVCLWCIDQKWNDGTLEVEYIDNCDMLVYDKWIGGLSWEDVIEFMDKKQGENK